MESKHVHLGYRLKKYRKLMGYSIRRAAKKAKVKPTRLSEWERGLRTPSIESLVRLAVIYRVMIDQLCIDLRQHTIRESVGTVEYYEEINSKIHREKPT
jgi:transcriptional regulator with XRE-family HTH domain